MSRASSLIQWHCRNIQHGNLEGEMVAEQLDDFKKPISHLNVEAQTYSPNFRVDGLQDIMQVID